MGPSSKHSLSKNMSIPWLLTKDCGQIVKSKRARPVRHNITVYRYSRLVEHWSRCRNSRSWVGIFLEVISNTRNECFIRFPNTKKSAGKTSRSREFLTKFEVFGNRIKSSFECLIKLVKLLIILGEIQNKSSRNFMIIKITFLNLLHGSDSLCFT